MGVRILIAGPGRSGTTLLVRLLDALGLDTGADRLSFNRGPRAGLESSPLAPEAARVVKSPELSVRLREMIESGRLRPEDVEWVLVPLRRLDDAAASRVRVALKQHSVRAPGGLIGTTRPGRQRERLAENTYKLFETAALYELPLIVLEYPRFATDPEYAFRRLQPLLRHCAQADFDRAWHSVVDPKLVRTGPLEMPRLAAIRAAPLRLRLFLGTKLGPVTARKHGQAA
jgi:cation diffusion facilitator CzcD-associated flavoprotein CzcO